MLAGLFKKKGRETRGFCSDSPVKAYPDPVLNRACTHVEVNSTIISDFVVERLLPIVGTHPFPLSELMLVATATCWFRPTHIFEWGTNVGKSARIFYETIRSFSIGSEIHSVDLPEDVQHVEHPHDVRGMMVRGIDGVSLHLGDGLSVSMQILSNSALPNLPLFFLDGDHEYESVKRELDAITLTRPDAPILIHDTFFQSRESDYNVGPHRAVEDVLSSFSSKYGTIRTETGLPGMTLLYPLPLPE